MSTTSKFFLGSLYVFLVVIFFLYFLFPSEQVKNYLLANLRLSDRAVSIQMKRLKPVFPPGLNLQTVGISYNKALWATVDSVTVTPALRTIFGPLRTFQVEGKAYGGTLSSRVEIGAADNRRQIQAETTLSAIGIKNIDALNRLMGRKISGTLSGSIVFDGRRENSRTMDAKLTLSDCQVEALYPLLDIKQLEFEYIQTDLSLSGTQVRIKNCDFKGPQINGRFTGSIVIRQPAGKSALNLAGRLIPQGAFSASLNKILRLAVSGSNPAGDQGIPVRIAGTLEQPTFSLSR